VLECLALDGVGERAIEGQKDLLALEVLRGGVVAAAPDTVAVSGNRGELAAFPAGLRRSVPPSNP
jgi:hypothetical protein